MSIHHSVQLVAELTDQDEAYRMLAAGEKIRRALADAGYAPR